MKDLFEFKDIIFCTSKVLDMGMRNEKQPISALNFLLDLPTNRQSNFLNAEHAQEPIYLPIPVFCKQTGISNHPISVAGFIQNKDLEAHLELDIPNYPSLKGISIKCAPEVYPLLVPLRDRAEESSLLNLLRSMSHALKSKSLFANESLDIDKQKLETVISVLKDFEIIGTSNISDLNHDDQSVTLSYVDSSGDAHQM
ncbi:unnamed protein product, partial [Nesidiocoris tenuis]